MLQRHDSMYWNIFDILPYQRNFNFINGVRSIGKTYTFNEFVLMRYIKYGEEFVSITRTISEKENGYLEKSFRKVVQECYPDENITFTNEAVFVNGNVAGYCLALSDSVRIKKMSFPNVEWLGFDEYMLESKAGARYINGWNEPDMFLSIYHTIDRERDKVKCFLMGNNTQFYNPYHMHKAFSIPENVKKGEIWTSKFVLFQWAIPTIKLGEEKSDCKFLNMIKNTEYENMYVQGEYMEDNKKLIAQKSKNAKFIFSFACSGRTFGVWKDNEVGLIFIDGKYNNTPHFYSLTLNDHSENTIYTKTRQYPLLNFLSQNFKLGNVRYTSMEVKTLAEEGIKLIL